MHRLRSQAALAMETGQEQQVRVRSSSSRACGRVYTVYHNNGSVQETLVAARTRSIEVHYVAAQQDRWYSCRTRDYLGGKEVIRR